MRISTNMIYDRNISAIQNQWSSILHASQQVNTGRRVLTPADDPIAASRALEVGQTKAVNSQFSKNIGYADDALKLLESQLDGAGEILHYVRTRAVQAGNGDSVLKDEDLRALAVDMKAQFEAMVAIANSQDGMGEYIFSGYSAQLKPFNGNLSGISYAGDQGERSIQVSASRYLPISLPGSDVFDRTLTLNTDTVKAYPGIDNKGSGTLNVTAVDAPAVQQASRYQFRYDAASGNYNVSRLGQDGIEVPPATTLPPGANTLDGLSFELPAPPDIEQDDGFELWVPLTNMLNNMAMFAAALDSQNGVLTMTGAVAFALETLDAGQENILKVRAQIGSQLTETEALKNLGSDLDIQYATTLSQLQDVSYPEAISQLTQQRTYLQAAQQSFMMVTGLSLFNFLG